jgi:mRNA-degrading endonuclease toxin of MazEF toxin-antitoxin module
MVDKIATLPKSKVGHRLGALNSAEIALLNQTLAMFLGFADEQTRA